MSQSPEEDRAGDITVTDYVDVTGKAAELGCNVPSGVAILPRNFDTATSRAELIHESTATTVRLLLRESGIHETPLEEPGDRLPFMGQKAATWGGPDLYMALAALQDPQLLTSVIEVISAYLTDFFRGIAQDRRRAKLSVVVQTAPGSFKKVQYEGPIEGLARIPDVVRRLR
jgi:hypothetical protein